MKAKAKETKKKEPKEKYVPRKINPWHGPAVKQIGNTFYNKKGNKVEVAPGSILHRQFTEQVIEGKGEILGDPKGSIES